MHLCCQITKTIIIIIKLIIWGNLKKPISIVVDSLLLDEEWGVTIEPILDNKWGDFFSPASDELVGVETRLFRYREEYPSDKTNNWINR